MNNKSGDGLLYGLVFYNLFSSDNGRYAFSLSQEMNINLEELESLVKSGCFSYLGFAQNKFSYEDYMMTQYQYERLKSNNPHLHEQLKDVRKKAQAKWSNELKNKFTPQVEAAQCLPTPMQWDLTLARIEASVSCARFLNQVGQVQKSKQILQLFAPEVTGKL
jgi:hypothetical protein